MASQPPSKLSKAKARLVMDHPFFATLLLRTQVIITEAIELAATDGSHIYYNPQFLDLCSVEDVMAVLVHEVGHDSLLHSLRLGMRNPDIANIAMDHAINLLLEDQGFKCPKSVPSGWLADSKYKGWNWERIYDDLMRNPPPPQGGQGEDPPKPGQRQRQNGSSGKPGAPQPGKDWLHGDVLPTPAKTEAEQAQAEQRAKQKVASAANMARIAGKLTGDLAIAIDGLINPKVHWTEVLREYMTQIVKARDNWTRRNRRFRDVVLPSRRETRMGPILFIPDTSGSMMGDDMKKICSEIAHCCMQTKPEHIRVVWADAQVKGEQVFAPEDFSYDALRPVGGGGTDMRVPLKHVEQYMPQVVILLTDGHTPWSADPCPFPVICLNTTTQKVPDWMMEIQI